MMSKSALIAAMAGGVTTAVVIAMAAGLKPQAADAHGGQADHAAAGHGEGHGDPHVAADHGSGEHGSGEHGAQPAEAHSDGHAESHGDAHADAHAPASGGHGEQPDPHAPAKPAVKNLATKPATPPATPPAKQDDSHAAPAAAPAKADPHAAPAKAADPHAAPDKAADPHAKPDAADAHGEAADSGPADDALKMLMEGNDRWVASQATNPNTDPARRKEVADKGQTPFVTVLSCSDSRMPVERLFDRGVGEVFTIRVAGNIAGTSEIGTVEYGLGHLHTPLLVVMGHTKCGAVAAAASGAKVHGKIADIVDSIEPAVERAKRKNPKLEGADLAAEAVKENVWQTVFGMVRESKEIRTMIARKQVKVVGAVCDISTGKVEWLGEHPWQYEMIDALGGVDTEKAEPAAHH